MFTIKAGELYMNNPFYRRYVDQTAAVNEEILKNNEQQAKADKDFDDLVAKLQAEILRLQKLIEAINTGQGQFANNENQQIALDTAKAQLHAEQINLEAAKFRHDNFTIFIKKANEAAAQKALDNRMKNAQEETYDGMKVIADFDLWAGRVVACGKDPKSTACTGNIKPPTLKP
jgi:hypothetical protein